MPTAADRGGGPRVRTRVWLWTWTCAACFGMTLVGALPAIAQTLSIAAASTPEGDVGSSEVALVVLVSASQSVPVTVDWVTQARPPAPQSAQPGIDYIEDSGTLTIPPGSSSGTIAVSVIGDYDVESAEFFDVGLSNPVNATLGIASAAVTIQNDDVRVRIGDFAAPEGDVGFTPFSFTLVLDGSKDVDVSASYSVVAAPGPSATADVDFVAATGTATVPAGASEAEVVVEVLGDFQAEGTELFQVVLSDPIHASLGDAVGLGQILNDDATVSVTSPVVAEGDAGLTQLIFTIWLSLVENSDVEVDWEVLAGTATPEVDYAGAVGTVVVPQGSSQTGVVVYVIGDLDYESDETLRLQLSNPVGASIGDGVGVGAIQNDDPFPSVSVADLKISEGDAGTSVASFELTLSARSILTGSVNYTTADGSATAPEDYVAHTGGVSFPAGTTTAGVDVLVNGDGEIEGDEVFTLEITDTLFVEVADGSAAAVILDDDAPTVPALDTGGRAVLVVALFGALLASGRAARPRARA